MRIDKVTCNQCDRDLTETTNCIDYRILLGNEKIPSTPGFVTAMAKHAHIEQGTCHFCNVSCLKKWVGDL